MLTPTRSRDLILRATVRVDHRLAREDLVNILIDHAVMYGAEGNPSARAIMSIVRTHLSTQGEIISYGDHNYQDWATQQVDKVWPAGRV